MKRKRYHKIGRAPIPRITCRICHRQIEHDAIEFHAQSEHQDYYNEAIAQIEAMYRNGMNEEQIMETLKNRG